MSITAKYGTPIPLTDESITPSIDAQTYTGLQIKPASSAIHITYKADETADVVTLVEDTDYTIKENGYGTNISAGSNVGSITIAGKYLYTGERTINFTINPAQITSATIADVAEQPYTGSEVAPNVDITNPNTNTKLVKGIDYELSYENNTAPGTATVTITGKGNWQGTVTKTFHIHLL